MSNTLERSDKAFERWHEASTKFDHVALTVSLALLGYLAGSYRPAAIAFGPDGLELVAILAIFGSTVAGFKRIEATVVTLAASHKMLSGGESAGALRSAAAGHGGHEVAINKATGEFMSPQQMMREAAKEMAGAKAAEDNFDTWARRSKRWYQLRNQLLLGGILALVVARIWSAYRSV